MGVLREGETRQADTDFVRAPSRVALVRLLLAAVPLVIGAFIVIGRRRMRLRRDVVK